MDYMRWLPHAWRSIIFAGFTIYFLVRILLEDSLCFHRQVLWLFILKYKCATQQSLNSVQKLVTKKYPLKNQRVSIGKQKKIYKL